MRGSDEISPEDMSPEALIAWLRARREELLSGPDFDEKSTVLRAFDVALKLAERRRASPR